MEKSHEYEVGHTAQPMIQGSLRDEKGEGDQLKSYSEP